MILLFANGLTITPATISFTDPQSDPITATISGGNAPYSIKTAPSSTIATASISGSTLTFSAVGSGTTSITITDSSTPANTAKATITVGAALSVSLGSVNVVPTYTTTVQISGGADPVSAAVTDMSGIPNTSVATVSYNATTRIATITGVALGQALVTFTDSDGETATTSVTVAYVPGRLQNFLVSTTPQHYSALPPRLQPILLPPWQPLLADGVPLVSGVISGRHLSGAPSSDTGAVADSNGQVLYTRTTPAITGGVLQKNGVVNGNNWGGTGAVAPAGYGWKGIWNSGSVGGTNIATYAVNSQSYNYLRVTGTGVNPGVYQDIPVIPGQTYTFCAIAGGDAGVQGKLWIGNTSLSSQWNLTPGTPVGSLGTFYGSLTGVNSSISSAGTTQVVYGTFSVPAGNSNARVLLQGIGATASAAAYFLGVQVIQGNRLQDYQDHEPNANYLNSSSPMNNQGSLLNVSGTPVYSYSSTTTSITITVPSTTYKFTDNSSTVTPPQFSQTYSGLVANTHYYFDIAYDIASNAYVVNGPSTAQYSSATMLQDCYRDGRVAIYANYGVTTPTSGTGGGTAGGGGGGGGSCPAAWQLIPTKEHGRIRADQIDIGNHIPGPGGWVRVTELVPRVAPIWRYTLERADGVIESFDVNDTHALQLASGEWAKVRDLYGGERLTDITGKGLWVKESAYIKDGLYISMEVEGHVYYLGDSLVHNPITL